MVILKTIKLLLPSGFAYLKRLISFLITGYIITHKKKHYSCYDQSDYWHVTGYVLNMYICIFGTCDLFFALVFNFTR